MAEDEEQVPDGDADQGENEADAGQAENEEEDMDEAPQEQEDEPPEEQASQHSDPPDEQPDDQQEHCEQDRYELEEDPADEQMEDETEPGERQEQQDDQLDGDRDEPMEEVQEEGDGPPAEDDEQDLGGAGGESDRGDVKVDHGDLETAEQDHNTAEAPQDKDEKDQDPSSKDTNHPGRCEVDLEESEKDPAEAEEADVPEWEGKEEIQQPYVECEEDAPTDDRERVEPGTFAVSSFHSTLNVMTPDGKLLMPVSDRGFQHLVACARSTAGLKDGRYLFEVRIVELRRSVENGKQRVPRQFCGVGFCAEGSSLFLGDDERSMGFDSEGCLCKDGRKSWMDGLNDRIRLDRQLVIGVLLNLDAQSPNANTLSLFVNGERLGRPQCLPETLKGKTLFPLVNFKNVTLHANFSGHMPFAPLPFACRTLQDAAQEDVESHDVKESQCQVLIPIGLPDEGTFAWLDNFKEKGQFTELSGRSVKEWAMKSGLWSQGHGRNFNDQPSMDFGLKELDGGTTRQVFHAIAPRLHRNYIVMEVQRNLLAEDRRKALAAFNAPHFKRVAMVVMGEPPEDFKVEVRENLLQARKDKVAAEVRKAKRPSKWDNGSQAVSSAELEAEVKSKVDEVKLTDCEMQSWFQKKNDGDIPEKELAKVFSDFSLPTADEGFQEIQFMWQGEKECLEHMQKWIAERKLTQRVEDLKPTEWFKKQAELWQQSMMKWKRKFEDWQDPLKRRRLEDDARRRREEQPQEKEKPLPVGRLDEKVVDLDEDEPPKPQKPPDSCDDVDPWTLEDLLDIGTGEPLFSKFTWEDWMMLELRFQLHVLVHGYKHCMNDPGRVSFHESHTQFYFETFWGRELSLRNYGVESIAELLRMVRDTIEVLPNNSVLDPQLSDDTPLENFVRLTEDYRRDRLRKLDAGDQTAALRLQKPQAHAHAPRQFQADDRRQGGRGFERGLQAAAVAVEASGTTGPIEVERAAKMSPAATGPHLLLPFPGLMQETLVERVRNVHMVRDLGVTTATDTVHHGAAMTATAGTGGTSMPHINHKEPKAPVPTRAVLAEDTLPMVEGATEVVLVPEADEIICITACGSTVLAAIKSDSPCPALVSAGDPEERLVLAIKGSMEWVYGLGACARKRVPVQGQPQLRGLRVKMQQKGSKAKAAAKTVTKWDQAWDRNRIWSVSGSKSFKKALLGHWRGTSRLGVPQSYEVLEDRGQLWCKKTMLRGRLSPSWRRISINRNKATYGTGDMSLDFRDVKKQPGKLVWRSERNWNKTFTWRWAGW
ncbi:Hnrnpu [Symbiodinium sp. CCMP2592]|nr:Hnrnpu [Symbiodinium sp. CCMP2592]